MYSRRRFVAGGVSALAVALAGCTDGLGTGSPTYTDWLADANISDDAFSITVEQPAELASLDDTDRDDGLLAALFGVEDAEVDQFVSGGGLGGPPGSFDATLQSTLSRTPDFPGVYLGSFDADTLLDGLREASPDGFEFEGSYEGYDFYRRSIQRDIEDVSSSPAFVGVDDGVLLLADPFLDDDPAGVLEAAIDASAGDAPRFVGENERFDSLDGAVDGEPLRWLGKAPTTETLVGAGYEFDGDDATMSLATVHADSSAATEFRDTLEELVTDIPLDRSETSVDVDGETVTLSTTHPTEQFSIETLQYDIVDSILMELTVPDEGRPVVSFDYNYTEPEAHLEILYISGDSVSAGQVTVEGSGFDNVGASWDELASDEGVTPESMVGPGDRAELTGVESDFELDIVWTTADGDDAVILSTRSGPDA